MISQLYKNECCWNKKFNTNNKGLPADLHVATEWKQKNDLLFLISAIDGLSSPCSISFIPGKVSGYLFCRRLGGPRASLDCCKEEKICFPYRISKSKLFS